VYLAPPLPCSTLSVLAHIPWLLSKKHLSQSAWFSRSPLDLGCCPGSLCPFHFPCHKFTNSFFISTPGMALLKYYLPCMCILFFRSQRAPSFKLLGCFLFLAFITVFCHMLHRERRKRWGAHRDGRSGSGTCVPGTHRWLPSFLELRAKIWQGAIKHSPAAPCELYPRVWWNLTDLGVILELLVHRTCSCLFSSR
jgi:hypothetical protein